jgi:hypothetical protein
VPPTVFQAAEAQPSRFCLTVSNHTTVPGWAVAGRTRGSPVGSFVGAGVVSGDVGAEVDVGAIDPRRVRKEWRNARRSEPHRHGHATGAVRVDGYVYLHARPTSSTRFSGNKCRPIALHAPAY